MPAGYSAATAVETAVSLLSCARTEMSHAKLQCDVGCEVVGGRAAASSALRVDSSESDADTPSGTLGAHGHPDWRTQKPITRLHDGHNSDGGSAFEGVWERGRGAGSRERWRCIGSTCAGRDTERGRRGGFGVGWRLVRLNEATCCEQFAFAA